MSNKEANKTKVACLLRTVVDGSATACSVFWVDVPATGLFYNNVGSPTTSTFLYQAEKDYVVPKITDKDFTKGKVCKTIAGSALTATSHATCKAECVKEANKTEEGKKGDACCSYNMAAATSATDGVCNLGTGKDMVDELMSS